MTPDEKAAYARQFPVFVGVDTAKRFHVLVALGSDGRRSKPFKVVVSRAGFETADLHLRALFPRHTPAQMLIGLEFAGHHGFTFARFLADRGYQVVNVLPAHTSRAKELEDNNPLKTDAKDAGQIARLTSLGIFVRFPFLQTPYVELRLLSVQRHRLTVETTRFKNRLQGLLDLAWPEFLGQFSGLHKRTPLAILERWPLPQDLLRAAPQTIGRHIRAASRGHISQERVRKLIVSARETVALTQALPERRLEITQLLARWALVREQIAIVEAPDRGHSGPVSRGEGPALRPRGGRGLCGDDRCRAGHPGRFSAPPPDAQARRDESHRPPERAARGTAASVQARPPDAPPPALPPGRPVVSASWTLSTRLRGDASAGDSGDQSRLLPGAEVGAAAAPGDADRGAV
jgi:transposase